MANAVFLTMAIAIRMGGFFQTVAGIWQTSTLTKVNGFEPPFSLDDWGRRLTAPAIDGKVSPICLGREPQPVSRGATGTQFSSAG
ncbi:MAG: hypothetical protein AAGA01_04580 [Cyanobacteria bacterium P01_E01_bin.43]